MQRFTAACVQHAITPMDVPANVARSVAWTRRAFDESGAQSHVHVFARNAVGADGGSNHYFGHSMIVEPIAHKLAQARGAEEVCFAERNQPT